MPTKRVKKRLTLVTITLLVLIAGSSFAESAKIILYPLAIHAENDLEFLKKGISGTIESQLESNGHPVTISPDALTQDQALINAAIHMADFAIAGSLTFFAETISINVLFLDVKSGKTLVALNTTETDKNNIFKHMETFATDISTYLNQKGQISETSKSSLEVPPPSNAEAEKKAPIASQDITKSKDYKFDAVSMAVGDVNNDGIKDIVIIDSGDIHIFTYQNKTFNLETTIKGSRSHNNLFVYAEDINNNNIDEIFITSIHSSSRSLISYVLEWNGSEYSKTVDKCAYFLAVTQLPQFDTPVLLGQRQGLDSDVFTDSITRLEWNAEMREYLPTTPVTLPSKKLTIFDIVTADFNGDGKANLIGLQSDDYLVAFNEGGEEIWQSNERYGGSLKYIEPRRRVDNSRVYMRPRVYAGDADLNGKPDIVTIINESSTPKFMPNLRSYKNGHIECFSWASLNMEALWKTQVVSGYIADFQISDLDLDQKNELIYCVTYKKGKIIKKSQTYIVIQKI